MIASRYVYNGNTRLHYLDSGGDDHGSPIVFIPDTDIADDYLQVMPLFGRRVVVACALLVHRPGGRSAVAQGECRRPVSSASPSTWNHLMTYENCGCG